MVLDFRRLYKRGVSLFTVAVRQWLIYVGVLVVLSILTYGQLVGDLGHRVFASNDDSSLFIFWFAHAADVVASWFGLGSGEKNPLYTYSMNAPAGVNGGWNTSVMGLALPLSPVTLIFGPVVAYNVAIMLSPVVSALAAAWAARQLIDRIPAFIAGLAYGFSTYLIAQSSGHLNLAFAVLPPLVVGFVIRFLENRGRTWLNAVGLGLAVGWQFYVSNELLAHTFIMAVVLMVVILVVHRNITGAGLARLAVGGAGAVAVAGVIGIPLLYTMFAMPGAPRDQVRPHGIWYNDLLDAVRPGEFTLIQGSSEPITRVMGIDPAEIGGYLGWVWIVVTAAIVLFTCFGHRLSPYVRAFALVAVVTFVLSLGSPIRFNGEEVLGYGPFATVEQIPVLENILPMRMSVHVTLMFALLLGVGWHMIALRNKRREIWPMTAVTVLVALSVTSGEVKSREIVYPEFYDSTVAQVIPEGSRVKMMPRPRAWAVPNAAVSMVGQAVSGMRFSSVDGYFIGSTDTQALVYDSGQDPIDDVMDATPLPAANDPRLAEAVADLRAQGVSYVLITEGGFGLQNPARDIANLLASASGSTAEFRDGVYVIDIAQ